MAYERILLDLESQRDFFNPRGSCYYRNTRKAASKIQRLFHWAKRNRIPIISTVLRIRKGVCGPLSNEFHCIEGTEGEQKLTGTIAPRRINLGLRNTTDLPHDIFQRYQQVIIEKRNTNIFAHARLERLITELESGTFILCGAGVAHGIVEAAIGLRSRGLPVILATDAVADLGDPLTEMAYLRMEAKGVIFAQTEEIITPRPAPRVARLRKSLHAN